MDPSPDVDVDSKEVLGATNFESSEVPVEEEPSDTSEKTIEKDPQDDNLCVSLEKLKIEGSSIPSVSSANDNTKTSDDNLKLDQKESQEKDSNKKNILSSREEKDEIKNQEKESMGEGHKKLYSWLNKNMKIEMTDGRILIGVFLCTDRDGNVILGSCCEYINPEVCGFSDEPRILGLVMVPGRHIVSIHHDAGTPQTNNDQSNGLYS